MSVICFIVFSLMHIQDSGYSSFGVRSDLGTSLNDVTVVIEDGAQSYSLRTNLEGNTGDFSADVTQPLAITIFEAYLSGTEESVGQHFVFDKSHYPALVDAALESNGGLHIQTYIPTAREVSFDSSKFAIRDGVQSRWEVFPMNGASFNFNPKVAPLLTSELIDSYFAYHSTVAPLSPVCGSLIRVDSTESVGNEGFLIEIEITGKGNLMFPKVFSAYVGNDPLGNGMTVQMVQVIQRVMMSGPNSLTRRYAQVLVTGSFRTGDNLIIISPQAVIQNSFTILPNPPVPPQNVDSQPPICQPPGPMKFDCYVDCELSEPKSEDGCFETLGPVTQGVQYDKVGGKLCSFEGTSMSADRCITYKGGISTHLTVGGRNSPHSFTLGHDGSVSGTECVHVTALSGYCAQAWLCMSTRTQKWEVGKKDENGLCVVHSVETTSCQFPGATLATSCRDPD